MSRKESVLWVMQFLALFKTTEGFSPCSPFAREVVQFKNTYVKPSFPNITGKQTPTERQREFFQALQVGNNGPVDEYVDLPLDDAVRKTFFKLVPPSELGYAASVILHGNHLHACSAENRQRTEVMWNADNGDGHGHDRHDHDKNDGGDKKAIFETHFVHDNSSDKVPITIWKVPSGLELTQESIWATEMRRPLGDKDLTNLGGIPFEYEVATDDITPDAQAMVLLVKTRQILDGEYMEVFYKLSIEYLCLDSGYTNQMRINRLRATVQGETVHAENYDPRLFADLCYIIGTNGKSAAVQVMAGTSDTSANNSKENRYPNDNYKYWEDDHYGDYSCGGDAFVGNF